MTELTTLQGKDSREAARVLAALSSSLLPQPGISEALRQPGVDPGILQSVITEIRHRLRVPENDFSITTQSKIYAFVSREISKAALANTTERSVKERLGNKGQLRPDQYQVAMDEETAKLIEACGVKKSNVIEAITHPDEVVHLQGSYTGDDIDARPTISIKSVSGKRADDDYVLLILSNRKGQTQQVEFAFRVYRSEVDLRDIRDPLDVLRALVQAYGLTFQLAGLASRFLDNEVIGVSRSMMDNPLTLLESLNPIEGVKGTYYYPFIFGVETHIQAPHSEETTLRVVFAFAIDISKYAISMRRHKVQLTPEEHWKFFII